MGKGYLVSHQKVAINVGLNGKLNGITELTITPTAADLKTVWLNARDCTVLSTSLRIPTSIPLAFSHLPPPAPVFTNPDVHAYPELKRAVWKAANGGEEGELGIGLPPGCIVRVPPPAAPEGKDKDDKVKEEWESIVIAIEYEVTTPGIGITVVQPDEANPSRFPHVFTATADVAARTWLPCSDSLWDRCTWDLEFTVPRLLYSVPFTSTSSAANLADGLDDLNIDDEDETSGEWPISVIASGELIEQVVHPTRSDRVIWHFSIATPVSVQQVGWAVGPFILSEITTAVKKRGAGEEDVLEADEEDEEAEEVVDEGPKLFALCLPGREEEMENSVGVIRQAMDFYAAKFGSYPFSSYSVAFVDSLASGAPTFHSAAMTLFGSELLHPRAIIDQAFESRHLFAHALAVQWSGINLIPRAPADTWLITGIALHITSLFLRSLWGNNEYRFRLKKDMMRCVAQDVQREPICVPILTSPHEPEQLQFIAVKAPLVLHILDKQLRKFGTSLGLDKLLPKLFLDAITGDLGSHSTMTLNALSTSHFLRTCRKSCGGTTDLYKTFSDQWIYGSGCPTFSIQAMFNRKKMAVELNITQDCASAEWAKTAPWEESARSKPAVDLFEGQLTIRIHEADGTPYEHFLTIGEKYKRHEVPFNTKYKRIRRNTKRYQARQAAATAAALGDAEAQEAMNMIDPGFGLPSWEEDEDERDRWRVADWTEDDDLVMSQATYEWIRIDADMEWICAVQFEQPDFMWLSQLQRDRDVVAQLEAVHALANLPSDIVASNLTKTVLVTNYFFRVRMEAILALTSAATKEHDYLGLFQLFKLFQSRYCFEPDVETKDAFGFRCIPTTNDFTDLVDYFLKKTIITAISMVRDERGQTPPAVQQFLVDLLAYNDNLSNRYSDVFYITTLFDAIGHSLVSVTPLEIQDQFSIHAQVAGLDGCEDLPYSIKSASEEIDRYMGTDRLVPSFHNAITVAGIQWKLKMTMANLIPKDVVPFFGYTREGNYPAVRIAAFDALLLLNTLDLIPFIRYYFSVIRNDSSLLVRRRLAQSILESLPILISMGDLAVPVKKGLAFEEEGAEKMAELSNMDQTLRQLRNTVGKSIAYRTCILDCLSLPNLDGEIRDILLKICESTIKPGLETVPKITLRMPTQVAVPEVVAPVLAPTPPPIRVRFNSSAALNPPPVTFTIPAASSGSSRMLTSLDNSPDPPARIRYTEDPDPDPVKPRKHKHKHKSSGLIKVPKSQTSGMSIPDFKACQSVLNKLLNSKVSLLFRNPVDPVKSGAPGYFDFVKSPMDLGTMHYKLIEGMYKDRDAFKADFQLVVGNAHIYNGTGFVVEQADEMERTFNKMWGRILKTLDSMDRDKIPKIKLASSAAPVSFLPPPLVPPPHYDAPPSTGPIKLRLSIAAPAAVSTPSAPPRSASHTPSLSTPSGFSFKIKLPTPSAESSMSPAPSWSAPLPAPVPAPLPLPSPSPASDLPRPSGFKVKFNSGSISSASMPPPAPPTHSFKFTKKAPVSYAEEPDLPLHPIKIKSSKKGKERENGSRESSVMSSSSTSALPPVGKAIDDPVNIKKARGVLKKMLELPESWFFQYPVEAVGALETYYDEIKRPMDLQTLSQRLEAGTYYSYRDFYSAFSLIVSNCKLFNPPGTEPVLHAEILDRAWKLEWEDAIKMSPSEKRSTVSLLNKLMREGAAFPFLQPLDPENQGFPEYFDFVPRANLRDLSSIKRNVEADRYLTTEAVEADVLLMIANCHAFNAPGTPVAVSGDQVKEFFLTGMAKIRSEARGQGSSGKRSGEKEKLGGTIKKQKMI